MWQNIATLNLVLKTYKLINHYRKQQQQTKITLPSRLAAYCLFVDQY